MNGDVIFFNNCLRIAAPYNSKRNRIITGIEIKRNRIFLCGGDPVTKIPQPRCGVTGREVIKFYYHRLASFSGIDIKIWY